ncbi:MAG: hypothetical protein HYX48_05060 [Chlamydiales bacterium]|nr:hypothetical protein [Chlamydiales bacterium]
MSLTIGTKQAVLEDRNMMGTIIAFNPSAKQLAAMSCVAKKWKAAVERTFPLTLVRLMDCSRVRVLEAGPNISTWRGFHEGAIMGSGHGDLWNPRHPAVGRDFFYNVWSHMATVAPVLSIDRGVVGIAAGSDRIHPIHALAGHMTVYDLQRDTSVLTEELSNGRAPVVVNRDGVITLRDYQAGYSSFSQNAEGVWSRAEHRIALPEETYRYLTYEGQTVITRRDLRQVEILDQNLTSRLTLQDPEMDAGDAQRGTQHSFAFSGNHLVIPLTGNRLRVYALEEQGAGEPLIARLVSTTEPFEETFYFVRIQGSKIVSVFENGTAQLVDALAGERGAYLPIDWGDLPETVVGASNGAIEPRRKIIMGRYLDQNKIALTLNTGSLQVFNISRSEISRHSLNVTGHSNITNLALKNDFIAISREQLVNGKTKWFVELWNWRLCQKLRSWDFKDPVYSLALDITASRSDIVVGISGGETRLLSSETRKLTTVEQTVETVWECICSFFEGIYNCLRDCFNWLDNF